MINRDPATAMPVGWVNAAGAQAEWTFVDNGQRSIDAFRQSPCAADAADIRRYDHDLAEIETLANIAHHHGRGIEVIGRYVEEALNLSRVQIQRHYSVRAGTRDEVADELG